MTVTAQPDPYALMTQQARAMWALGDFARAGAEQVVVAELLCRAAGIHPGERVLDVAAGSGNAALADAQQRYDEVIGDFPSSQRDHDRSGLMTVPLTGADDMIELGTERERGRRGGTHGTKE